MPSPAVLVWILLASIWGSTWLAIKLGLDSNLPPFTLMWARFAVAGLTLGLLALTRLAHMPKQRGDWWMIALTGNMVFTINYIGVYWAETQISSGLAAIVYTTLPLMGGLIAHFMLPDEPLTLNKVCGVVLGIAGVILISADTMEVGEGNALLGIVAILVAVLCTALSSTMIKLRLRHIDPVILTGTQIWLSLPFMVALGLYLEGSPLKLAWTPIGIGSVIYLGVLGTAVSFGLLNWLFRHMAVTKTQLIPLASTMIAVLLGWWVRDERHGPLTWVASALILCGLAVATWPRRPAPKPEPTT